MDLYPLKFQPMYQAKVWGGRALEKLGRLLPRAQAGSNQPDPSIGESWELVDLAATTSTQASDQPVSSVVSNGPLAGRTLHDVMTTFGRELMGDLQPTPEGLFPLLVKYLDARQNVSLQVHPSLAYALEHPESHLKSEAWYIVAAEPGAVIYKGLRRGTSPEAFRAAVLAGDVAAMESMLLKVPVKAGDCHYVPSGTCHALGAGTLVAEVQTPSDTTFRIYDWGRQGRAMQIDQAMQCVDFGPPDVAQQEKRTHIAGMFTTISRLVLCEHFRIEKVRMIEGYEQEIPYDQPSVWMVMQGSGVITPGGSAPKVEFAKGDTLLIPASMPDPHIALKQDTVWLEVTFPKAMPEKIA